MSQIHYPVLSTIDSPADLRGLEERQLQQLAGELREFLIESVASTGGHLSAGLGTVELTIALHYIFATPHDRLVWDIGHQAYPHKILTVPVTPARRSARHWAWPWPPGRPAATAGQWQSSVTAP